MFDARLRPLIDPPLDSAAKVLVRLGVTANHVTIAGFLIGMLAVPLLAVQAYLPALALILANRLCDGLDGAIARRRGSTDLGGFLDITLDFLFYSAVPFGFALGQPEVALAATFLTFSFVGTGTSFLAYAVIAAKRGETNTKHRHKSLVYLGGLTEGAETILVFCLFCLVPSAFVPIAVLFGLLCFLTTATRIFAGVANFAGPKK